MSKIPNVDTGKPKLGAAYLWRGFKTMWRPGLRSFVLAPLAINISLFTAAIYWLSQRFSSWVDGWLASFPSWLSWLEYLLWPLFILALLLVVFYGFALLANLIAAPFNGVLAEKVEIQHTGHKPETGRTLAGEVGPAISSEIRKLSYIVPCLLGTAILALILGFIPVVNALVPLLWLLVGGWLMGLEYIEFPLGNHGKTFPAVRQWSRERRSSVWSFGITASALTAIPVVNFFVMPAAVVGATLLTLEHGTAQHGATQHRAVQQTANSAN